MEAELKDVNEKVIGKFILESSGKLVRMNLTEAFSEITLPECVKSVGMGAVPFCVKKINFENKNVKLYKNSLKYISKELRNQFKQMYELQEAKEKKINLIERVGSNGLLRAFLESFGEELKFDLFLKLKSYSLIMLQYKKRYAFIKALGEDESKWEQNGLLDFVKNFVDLEKTPLEVVNSLNKKGFDFWEVSNNTIASTKKSYVNPAYYVNFTGDKDKNLEIYATVIRNAKFNNVENIVFAPCVEVVVECADDVKSIYFHSSVERIAYLKRLDNLEKIVVEDGNCVIEEDCFTDCPKLYDVSIGENVSLESRVFKGTQIKNLKCKDFEIKDGFAIKDNTLLYFTDDNAKEVVIPQGIEIIKEQAFSFIENLKNVQFPSSLKKIGYNAFRGCSSLEKIVIPDSVESIASEAFASCKNLCEFVADKNLSIAFTALKNTKIKDFVNKNFIVSDYLVIQDDVLLRTLKTDIENVVIPDGIKCINPDAFYWCSSLESVSFPEGLLKIDDSAFRDCSSLKEITLPKSIEHVSNNAFYNCDNLSLIRIKNPDFDASKLSVGNCEIRFEA